MRVRWVLLLVIQKPLLQLLGKDGPCSRQHWEGKEDEQLGKESNGARSEMCVPEYFTRSVSRTETSCLWVMCV